MAEVILLFLDKPLWAAVAVEATVEMERPLGLANKADLAVAQVADTTQLQQPVELEPPDRGFEVEILAQELLLILLAQVAEVQRRQHPTDQAPVMLEDLMALQD